jgi:hypothetical protein
MIVESITMSSTDTVVSAVCRALTPACLAGSSADTHITISRTTPYHDHERADVVLAEPSTSALCDDDRSLIAALAANGHTFDYLVRAPLSARAAPPFSSRSDSATVVGAQLHGER